MTSEIQNLTPEQIQLLMQLLMQLEGVFSPLAKKQRNEAFLQQTGHEEVAGGILRFVHYTSAEAALNIIRSKRIWMRNATCMTDYREMQHGLDILNRVFFDTAKKNDFVTALDTCVPGAAREAIGLFNQWTNDVRLDTYITSISLHYNEEDLHGRLSMWRAFGGNTAHVAIVFAIPMFSGAAIGLNLIFSPVAYLAEEQVHGVIDRVIKNIDENRKFLHSVDRRFVVASAFTMLLAAATCLKHEGFHEEREWRAIYSPKRLPSLLMESSTEVIGGIPQHVYKIPLDATADPALADLDFSKVFDRLIIGPSQFPGAMAEAFNEALSKVGVRNVHERIYKSGIPIRV